MNFKVETIRLTNMTGTEFKGYRMTILNADTEVVVFEKDFDNRDAMNKYRARKGMKPYAGK